MMGDEGSTIRDKVFAGLAILVGVSPLLYVVVAGLRTVDRRMAPENEPSKRIEQLGPQLGDILSGTKSAQAVIDWLEHPSRRDYLLIRDQRSGETYVVDWYGTPYFFRVTGRLGRTLVDRRGNRFEGDLTLERIGQFERLVGMRAANLTLLSLGPNLRSNNPYEKGQDDIKRVFPIDPQTGGPHP